MTTTMLSEESWEASKQVTERLGELEEKLRLAEDVNARWQEDSEARGRRILDLENRLKLAEQGKATAEVQRDRLDEELVEARTQLGGLAVRAEEKQRECRVLREEVARLTDRLDQAMRCNKSLSDEHTRISDAYVGISQRLEAARAENDSLRQANLELAKDLHSLAERRQQPCGHIRPTEFTSKSIRRYVRGKTHEVLVPVKLLADLWARTEEAPKGHIRKVDIHNQCTTHGIPLGLHMDLEVTLSGAEAAKLVKLGPGIMTKPVVVIRPMP